MGILFLKSGLFTTVQDAGRMGYQKSGFGVSGVMDTRSYMIANLLLDNPESEAVLEYYMVGPTIQFTSDTIIAITGGEFTPKLNKKVIPTYTAVYVHKNDILELGYSQCGNWGYIAFSSKLDIPVVMGSRSTNTKCKVGGYHGRKIQDGDQIWFRAKKRYLPSFLSRTTKAEHTKNQTQTIRVLPGPQEEYFTKQGLQTFYNTPYKLTSDCDRMGYRLEGEFIAHTEKGADIISDGIAMGAIQVPTKGKPIIMLADRQTTGGYTKIANVISVDIPKLVQQKEGESVIFEKVTIEEAQKLYLAERKEFDELRRTIHHPCKEVLNPRITAKRISTLYEN